MTAGVLDDASCRASEGGGLTPGASAKELIVEEVETLEGLLKLEPEWRRLQEAVGSLPFTSWEWNFTWWHHLSRHSLAVSDRLFVKVVREPDGALVALAPLLLREYPGRGPRFRCLRYFGADPGITEIRGPLCRREREGEICDALLRHLFAHDHEWSCFILDGLRTVDGAALLTRKYEMQWTDTVPDFTLALPKTWEEFRATRSRNIKESLRKCANSLRRAELHPVHRVASSGAELRGALDAFFRLHAARASRAGTIRHQNVFEAPLARRFLRAVVERLAASDSVRIFTLELESRTVAARVAFRAGRSLYLYYSGYDPAFAKYSVMTSVVAQAIRYAIVNLSTGRDLSKTRWSPAETAIRQAAFSSKAELDRIATAAYLRLRGAWLARQSSPATLTLFKPQR
jgi:CelD/BcsL family acetyltransferase involved in cellulose biosynthesis